MTVIVTAGHVDHGKSSLVRAICGTDPDRLAEEKRRGMTIDLGFAHRILDDGTTLSFVDVPGHADLIRTMVAGAGAADVAMLVVDAGEGWMAQTEEHAAIIELLGIDRGVVAVTKTDRVDAPTIERIADDIRARLADAATDWSAIVPVSVIDGTGLGALVEELRSAVSNSVVPSTAGRRSRLFVDRVFTMRGQGTVVTGTLDTGSVAPNDRLEVCRTGDEVRIRRIQTHGEEVAIGDRGNRCALNITGDGSEGLRRGDALVSSGAWFRTCVFDADMRVVGSSFPLRRRDGFMLHIGTSDQSASVRVIGDETIAPGSKGLVRIRFDVPLPLAPGDRFLLRDPGTATTVGGGTVLDVDPRARLSRAAPDGSVQSQMQGRGWIDIDDARRLTGEPLEAVAGRWFATDDVVRAARAALEAVATDGTLDVAVLSPPERALLDSLDIALDHGRADRGVDSLEMHPIALATREAGITPPSSASLDRDTIRRLVAAGILFEHDGLAFHRDCLDALRPDLSFLWSQHPDGFTVSHLRGQLGITRKHAVPLAECLDRSGLTSRRGDVRVRGPRF